jgi:16S rRNA (adenine1518-N6/adenine1519-N6)-dimethyltransferase
MPIRKRFGQHFLEPAWVDKVIRAIDPQADEAFIEIGPGRGALTRPLVARAKTVTAFEIDRDLAAQLSATAPPNLTVVEGDFLEAAARHAVLSLGATTGSRPTTNDERPATNDQRPTTNDQRLTTNDQRPTTHDQRPTTIRVAGNLPYNVASPILFTLVELYASGVPLVDATVMLQREVADRLVAPPGGREYGVLSILIRHAADVDLVLKLPPGAFRPPPKVLSALVRLRFHPPDPPVADPATFAAIVQAVFTRRRKTLANALRACGDHVPRLTPADALAAAGLNGTRRPETLAIGEFARLADVYAAKR